MRKHLVLWIPVLIALLLGSSAGAADPNDFIVWTGDLPGRLYVPDNYDAQQSYPLILFYHGAGEGGTDNTSQVNGNINNLFAECQASEVFLYAPQSPTDWFDDARVLDVMEKVDDAIATYNIDTDRIYVTGLSAGGKATYNTMEVHGSRFAAAVVVCGVSNGTARDDTMVGKPMWLFHAADDGTVVPWTSRDVVNSIRNEDGGKAAVAFPLDADPANPYYNTGAPYYSDGSTFYSENELRYTTAALPRLGLCRVSQ